MNRFDVSVYGILNGRAEVAGFGTKREKCISTFTAACRYNLGNLASRLWEALQNRCKNRLYSNTFKIHSRENWPEAG